MKLLTMAKKNFWTGMLAIVLVFGMTAIACDNGTTNGNGNGSGNGSGINGGDQNGGGGGGQTPAALNGTWDGTGSATGVTVIFNNGNFELFVDGVGYQKGTFTTSGSTMTLTITHIHSSIFAGSGITLVYGWRTRAEIRTAMIAFGLTPAQADDELNHPELFGSSPFSGNFNVSGNILTLFGDTFTRRT